MCQLGHKVFTVIEGSDQTQHAWRLAEISEYLYPTKDVKHGLRNLTNVWQDIQDVHKELWPGQAVPARTYWEHELHCSKQPVVPTSLFIALVVWSVCAPKRSEDSRRTAEEFLAALFKRAAQNGFPVSFQKFEADGSCTRCDTFVDSSLVIDCWTDSMSTAMAIHWDSQVLSGLPHPKSSRTQTSVQDFVVWALRPVAKRANIAHLFHERKHLCRMTALSIITHMTRAIEQTAVPQLKRDASRRIDYQPESEEEEVNLRERHSRRRHISRFTSNLVAERAANLLFSGKDTWMIKESVRLIHFF